MKNTFQKLKSKRGETLVSILVAILIIALSAGLFATMYSVATSINLSARNEDKKFYEAVGKLEEMESQGASEGTLTYRPNGGGEEQSIPVDIVTQDGLSACRGKE